MGQITQIVADAWAPLRQVTPARIALGRSGGSIPTHEWLNFKGAHASARDAVHCPFEADQLAAKIAALGVHAIIVDSAASERRTFLLRPDLGRRLDDRSRYMLQELSSAATNDLTILVTDGLSALAAHRQVLPLLERLLPKLNSNGWRITPIIIARFGRVALQDEVGQVLGSQLALILIGERPGLGSPDSLGAYLVYGPGAGNTDAHRNCVSNIRPDGLSHEAAADTIFYLLSEAHRRHISGVQLKDQRTLAAPGEIPRAQMSKSFD